MKPISYCTLCIPHFISFRDQLCLDTYPYSAAVPESKQHNSASCGQFVMYLHVRIHGHFKVLWARSNVIVFKTVVEA